MNHHCRFVGTLLVAAALLVGCGDGTETANDVVGTADNAGGTAAGQVTSTSGVATTDAAPDAPPDGETYEFTIPSGTGAKLDAGEAVDVLPERLEVRTGDLILIHNEDERNHVVGPFYVPAADTMEHTFVVTGEFAGACSAHASGQITVVVT